MKFVAGRIPFMLSFSNIDGDTPIKKINKITAIVFLKKEEERKIIILDDRVNRNA